MPTDTFIANGTWTCPTGYNRVDVECWGGGSGGRYNLSGNGASTGGGGGAYAKKSGIAVVPGNGYTVTVGAGGPANSFTHGGESWFISDTTVIADGGNESHYGGIGGDSGPGYRSIGDVVYAGGNGGVDINGQACGGGGGAGTTQAGGAGSTSAAGTGGSSFGGAGGTTSGTSGSTLGGGGGTSGSGGTHGNGARGEVRITYYYVAPPDSMFFAF